MNLHTITTSNLDLLLEYCIAKFPTHWNWRITGTQVEYSTEGNRFFFNLQAEETHDYTTEAKEWHANGRPPLR
jgi:hypothetical protein